MHLDNLGVRKDERHACFSDIVDEVHKLEQARCVFPFAT